MKFVRFDNWSTGVVASGDRVLNLTAAVTSPAASRIPAAQVARAFLNPDSISWDAMIAGWPVVRPAMEELLDRAESGDRALAIRDLATLRLLPPLPSPRARIFAMAANFADHLARAFSVMKGTPFTEEAGRAGGAGEPALRVRRHSRHRHRAGRSDRAASRTGQARLRGRGRHHRGQPDARRPPEPLGIYGVERHQRPGHVLYCAGRASMPGRSPGPCRRTG